MHLTIWNVIKSFLKGGYVKGDPKNVDDDDHSYIKGDVEDRGPCPGLNALANMGYLPRDGKAITLTQTQHALMTALHMDWLAAASLTATLPPLLHDDGTYDLVDTRQHNVIEHDSSFTRLDFHQGDNYTFQRPMLEAMIADAQKTSVQNTPAAGSTAVEKPVTLRSLARTFKRRDVESRAAGASRLPLNLWFVRLLQAVGVMNTAQTGGVLTREVLEAVFVEERFPDVILKNLKPRTVKTLLVDNALGMMRWVIFGP